MSAGLYAALAVGVGLGAYALYRANEDTSKVKVNLHSSGAGSWVDYKNPADARSDKRPQAAYLLKPYQILNIGGGQRPMEIDAQGQPTGRDLQLPGEAASANAILVGAEKLYNYQNERDAHVDMRPEGRFLVKPYEIFNPGGGVRPMEIDAQGGPTGRQLVLPGESPTVASPSQYVMVGATAIEHRGAGYRGAGYRGAGYLPSLGHAARGEWGAASAQSDYFVGQSMARSRSAGYHGARASARPSLSARGEWGDASAQSDYVVGFPVPYHAYNINQGGGGGGMNALAMRRRMLRMKQQMQLQQQLAQQQAQMQQQLADAQMQAQLAAQQLQTDAATTAATATADDGTAGLADDGTAGLGTAT